MLSYSATLSSAMDYAREEKMDVWIHTYLNHEGRNVPFSAGLKRAERYFFSPARFPRDLFVRCTGPEEDMIYRVDPEGWESKISGLMRSIRDGADMPPLIVQYSGGRFILNDGNHRHRAYEKLGIETVSAIIWITEDEERMEFMDRYGDYVKECNVIRR